MNEKASQKPFDGIPYTRLAAGLQAATLMCAVDVFVSRRVLTSQSAPSATLIGAGLLGRLFCQSKRFQFLGLFPYQAAVGLIFHHGLRAVLGTLFLPETCFGAGSHLIRSSCQCRLLFGGLAQTVFRDAPIDSNVSSVQPPVYICSSLRI